MRLTRGNGCKELIEIAKALSTDAEFFKMAGGNVDKVGTSAIEAAGVIMSVTALRDLAAVCARIPKGDSD